MPTQQIPQQTSHALSATIKYSKCFSPPPTCVNCETEWQKWWGRTHCFPDVGQCEPQGEDDGHDEEVGEALAVAIGPAQAQRLVLVLLILSLHKVMRRGRGEEREKGFQYGCRKGLNWSEKSMISTQNKPIVSYSPAPESIKMLDSETTIGLQYIYSKMPKGSNQAHQQAPELIFVKN